MATSLTSEHREYRWHGLINNGPGPDSIEGRVKLVCCAWDSGDLTPVDVQSLLFDLALHDGIEGTLQLLEDPWRTELLNTLTYWALADPSEMRIHIFGGIYAYELEPDPVKAAQMRSEVEARRAAEEEYFMTILRPRIREWWSRQAK